MSEKTPTPPDRPVARPPEKPETPAEKLVERAKAPPPPPGPAAAAPPRPEARPVAPPPPPPGAPPPKPQPQPQPKPGAPLRRGVAGLAALVLLGFAATAGGGYWLWQQQQQIAARIQPPPPTVDPAQLAALQQQGDQLRQQDDKLRQQVDQLQQRLGQVEQRPAPAPQPQADLHPLETRIAQLSSQLQALQQQSGNTQALNDKIDALQKQVSDAQQTASQAAQHDQAAIQKATRAARLQAAAQALEAGQPLGEIPGAPPALSRYANSKPPTEAELRLSFPAAASKAQQASDTSAGAQSLPQRMWQRMQGLVTVRQGDKVLVGAPAARVLAEARRQLDAGDLAGAVGMLDQLDPAAAKAMAPWREQAQALLDARAALTKMAQA